MDFLKNRDRQNLWASVERGIELKFLFDDSDQHVGGDSAPDLRLHGALAGAQEFFDAQLLLDLLEEQLHPRFVWSWAMTGAGSVVLLVRKI